VRVLITGASGLAGGWLARACRDGGDQVLGLSRSGAAPDGCEGVALDLTDGPGVRSLVASWAPEVVYHLAALSSVGRSWEEPGRTLAANVSGAVELLEAVRAHAIDARVVWVSSGEVYGSSAALPIGEDSVPAPESPYAVSKLAAEQLAAVYAAAHDLRVVVARPFSHAGPGQRPIFLMANLCRQAALGRRDGVARLRITTGNPDTRRDFTDVRDVVRAYRLLAASSRSGIFNVCSGASVSAAEQVATLAQLIAPIEVNHVIDPSLVRASEITELRGDPSRLTAITGWTPQIPFAHTMADTLAFWERELGAVRHSGPTPA
jgi:GDP-4-dehydro-6-deoxy-D-mannose reductase